MTDRLLEIIVFPRNAGRNIITLTFWLKQLNSEEKSLMWHKYILAAFILLLFSKLPKGSQLLNAANVSKDDENVFSRNTEVSFLGWFKPRKSLLLISSPDFSFVCFGEQEAGGWPHYSLQVSEEDMERELPSSFPWDPVIRCMGMGQGCTQGGS